jgi:arylsulfatase A-like enzyme
MRPLREDKVLVQNTDIISKCGIASIVGASIGAAECVFGEQVGGGLSFVWITAAYSVASSIIMLLALLAALVAHRLQPLWFWLWTWISVYATIFLNATLLPLESFLSLRSLLATAGAITIAAVIAGILSRFLSSSESLASSPVARRAGSTCLVLSVLITNAVPLVYPTPDLSTHHRIRRPEELNAVVILVDTLRADHVSSYGYNRPTTPHIDRLASRGIRFSRAYSTSSWTLPAVASLFSGVSASSHGVIDVDSDFRISETLAHSLADEGVVTAAIISNPIVSSLNGFHRGFNTFISYRDGLIAPVVDLASGTTLGRVLTRKVDGDRLAVNAAVEWLESHAKDRFFLYLHLFAPHRPYEPPNPHRDKFVDVNYRGIEYNGGTSDRSLTPPELNNVIERYDAEIAYADALVGEIVDVLDRFRLIDSTILIVTSDHGEAFGEHGRWEHGQSVYAEEARIPMIIVHPLGKNGVVDEPVSLSDLTLAIRSSLRLTESRSVSDGMANPLHARSRAESSRPILTEVYGRRGSLRPETMQAIVMGNMRLVHNVATGKRELFDIIADPDEMFAVIDQDAAAELETHFVPGWWEVASSADGRVELGDEDVQKLRSLGYIK